MSITHVAGTIEISEKDRLKKLLFRATRGKALTFFQDIIHNQPQGPGVGAQAAKNSKLKDKAVYIVVFQEGP